MTDAIINNLKAANILINKLTVQQYTNTSIGPYHSSVGSHIRHILDVFSCAFNGLTDRNVNLINRERNDLAETIPAQAEIYLEKIIEKLETARLLDGSTLLKVTDDLGSGPITLDYTLSGLMAQAHSHAIHHFACIGYMLEQMDVVLPDKRFGYNPTTPEKV